MKTIPLISRITGHIFVGLFLTVSLVQAGVAGDGKTAMELVKEAKSSVTQITAAQANAEIDAGKKLVLVDVRTKEEYDAAHLPRAINISRGVLEFKIGKMIPDKTANILLYCRTGSRGALATVTLKIMGYKNVRNMSDAFKGWSEAGYSLYNRHGEFSLEAFEKKETEDD